MVPVTIECYEGRKADERPVRFRLGEYDYFIEEIVHQWYGPDGAFFKVRADDGDMYVLRHDASMDTWSLEATRSS